MTSEWNIHGLVNGPLLSWQPVLRNYPQWHYMTGWPQYSRANLSPHSSGCGELVLTADPVCSLTQKPRFVVTMASQYPRKWWKSCGFETLVLTSLINQALSLPSQLGNHENDENSVALGTLVLTPLRNQALSLPWQPNTHGNEANPVAF
jgi:hypothetical protein